MLRDLDYTDDMALLNSTWKGMDEYDTKNTGGSGKGGAYYQLRYNKDHDGRKIE